MKIALLLASAALATVSSAAEAAVDIYISDNGQDSFLQATGSLNLAGFAKIPGATEPGSNLIQGRNSVLFAGDATQGLQAYTGLTNNNRFGGFTTSFGSSGTGTGFGINGIYTLPRLLLPVTYTSGDAITSTATFLFDTVDSLGLIRGDYVFASSSDTITLHVGRAAPAVSAVPEPTSWLLMIAGFGAVGGALRGRRPRVRFA